MANLDGSSIGVSGGRRVRARTFAAVVGGLTALLFLLGPSVSTAGAQECVGFPGGPGEVGIGLSATPFDMIGSHVNLPVTPSVSVTGSFQGEHWGNIDRTQYRVGGRGTVSLRPGSVELCPTLGVEYGWMADDSWWWIPAGLGVGGELASGEAWSLSPFGVLQGVYRRWTAPRQGGERTVNDVWTWLDAGAMVTTGAWYASGSVRLQITYEGSPVFERGLFVRIGRIF